jgi:hypothetical protein
MNKVYAYAIIATKHLATFDHRLPIFWDRDVAVEECEKQNDGRAIYQVVKVKVTSEESEL